MTLVAYGLSVPLVYDKNTQATQNQWARRSRPHRPARHASAQNRNDTSSACIYGATTHTRDQRDDAETCLRSVKKKQKNKTQNK